MFAILVQKHTYTQRDFLMNVHQAYIIKFGKTIKHRTRKWTQGYNMSILGTRHIRNITNQCQTNVTIAIFGRNTGIVNYQFV